MHLLLRLIAALPLRFLQLIGAGIGEVIFRRSERFRRLITENLTLAGIRPDDAFLDRIGRASGRQAVEGIWVWYRPAKDVLKRVTITDETKAMIGDLMRSSRPIVFMTPHIGCFEVLPVWLAATFYKETGRSISILFRPPKFDILRKLVGDARQAPGIEACPTTVIGVKKIIRNLRAGHTFGALPDQVPSNGQGVWADFFGKPAYTATLPVRVAHQFDAVRVFAWGKRTNLGWTLEAEVWDEPLTGNAETDARAMNARIEAIIRRMPEQYVWNYNRYKCPDGIRRPS